MNSEGKITIITGTGESKVVPGVSMETVEKLEEDLKGADIIITDIRKKLRNKP